MSEMGSHSNVVIDRKFAVLLLAHGTPETVEEIPEYLKNVVSGRAIPQHVVEEIQSRYAQIGKSPLTGWTFKQANLLQQKIGLPVYVGMRNWKPYIAEAVRSMRADGITDAVAICLAPQNSRTSVGLYRRAAYAEAGTSLRFHFVDAWADHPRLVDAFAERLRPVWVEAWGQKCPFCLRLIVCLAEPFKYRQFRRRPTSRKRRRRRKQIALAIKLPHPALHGPLHRNGPTRFRQAYPPRPIPMQSRPSKLRCWSQNDSRKMG